MSAKLVQPDLPFTDPYDIATEVVIQLVSPDEIFASPDKYVASIGEDRRIERKPSGIHVTQLGEYFSMWANTWPDGGLIAVGIADGGAVEGCSQLPDKRLNDLEKTGYDRCPDAKYDVLRVPMARTKDRKQDFILLFRVYYHPTKAVETCDGRIFVRRGESKIELKNDEEKRQLRIDKGEVQHEQEPCGLTYPEDFDAASIRDWAEEVRTSFKWSGQTADEKVLEMMHLGRRRDGVFKPNIACALVFAKDPLALIPGCKVRFFRFDGTTEGTGDKFNAVKDELIAGTVPDQIDRVRRLLESQIRKFSGLGRDNKFQTTPEYPHSAWHEAVVNACVHRSYNFKNMNIFIKMFDDRLEIESPGPFPPPVTPENIYDIQHARNPFLLEALRHLEYTKGGNEGARRMRETMLEMKLPAPEFRQVQGGGAKVRVVLRNNIASRRLWVDSDVANLIGMTIANTLDEDEKLVVNFIAVQGKINVSEAQRLTGHTWHTCKKLLTRLVEEKAILGYVHREDVEVDRQAHYVMRTRAAANSSTKSKNGQNGKSATQ